jgi:predicted CopG family antitoxin
MMKKTMKDSTMIWIEADVSERIKELGNDDESYNDILLRILPPKQKPLPKDQTFLTDF